MGSITSQERFRGWVLERKGRAYNEPEQVGGRVLEREEETYYESGRTV
jgi:hypothetical protein